MVVRVDTALVQRVSSKHNMVDPRGFRKLRPSNIPSLEFYGTANIPFPYQMKERKEEEKKGRKEKKRSNCMKTITSNESQNPAAIGSDFVVFSSSKRSALGLQSVLTTFILLRRSSKPLTALTHRSALQQECQQ